jgi:hypothetical protein
MTTSLITSNLIYRAVKNFQDTISSGESESYVFYGRPMAWDVPGTPNTITNSQAQINKTWSNILAMKKIYNNDVSLVFANNVWTTGTVYDYYTDNQDLNDLDYFVVTQDNHVFKCIDNNYGAASTVEPAPEDPNSYSYNIGWISLEISFHCSFIFNSKV